MKLYKIVSQLLIFSLLFGILLKDAPDAKAAGRFVFNFPGTFTLGSEVRADNPQKYVDHFFTYTDNGTKHEFKIRWSQYTMGEFEEVSGPQKAIWIYKIFLAWLDGKEFAIDEGVRSKYYLKSQPTVTNSDGVSANSRRTATDMVFIKCLGSSIPASWFDWNGTYDCTGSDTSGATELQPRGDNSWSVWISSALGCKNTGDCDSNFWGAYIASFGDYVRSSKPLLEEAKLPQSAIDKCKSTLIQPMSSTNWGAVTEIESMANDLATHALDAQGGKMPKNKVFDPGFRDQAKDLELYRVFYQEDLPYSNKHLTQGDYLDQYQQTALAEINSWDTDEAHLKVGGFDVNKSLSDLLGVSMVAGIAGGGAKLTKAGLSKAGAAIAKKRAASAAASTAAKQLAAEATIAEGAAVEGGAAVTTEAAATTVGGKIAVGAAGVYALVGAIVIGGTLYGIDKWTESKNNEYYKKVFESWIGMYYAQKHLEFHACILEKGGIDDATKQATGFSQDMFDHESVVVQRFADANAQFQGNANQLQNDWNKITYDKYGCPNFGLNIPFVSDNNTLDPFNWAFCKIFSLLYEALAWVVEQANKLALMSVGANFTK